MSFLCCSTKANCSTHHIDSAPNESSADRQTCTIAEVLFYCSGLFLLGSSWHLCSMCVFPPSDWIIHANQHNSRRRRESTVYPSTRALFACLCVFCPPTAVECICVFTYYHTIPYPNAIFFFSLPLRTHTHTHQRRRTKPKRSLSR